MRKMWEKAGTTEGEDMNIEDQDKAMAEGFGAALALTEEAVSDTPKGTPRTDRETYAVSKADISFLVIQAYKEKCAELSTAQAELAECRRDAERLDFVQAQTKGYGHGWILRNSISGRGMRLHETDLETACATVRAAIDEARKGKS